MPKYKVGDVVIVLFPFRDGKGAKKRPAVILEDLKDKGYLVCQITSKDRSGVIDGYWITKDSKAGKEMGILQDSFLAVNNTAIIGSKFMDKKTGICKIVLPKN